MHALSLNAGETVFRTGEPSSAVYVIEHGEIAIRSGEGAAMIDIVHLHDGDLFGESGVLEGRVRSASAVAVVPTTLLATEADAFLKAFGVNDKALSLLKLLCRRLRNTTREAAFAKAHLDTTTIAEDGPKVAPPPPRLHLIPDSERLLRLVGPETIDIGLFPFQVGNRYGGETSPITSDRSYCVPAATETDFAAPHFEILQRGSSFHIRDLSLRTGTIVNGTVLSRSSPGAASELDIGDNLVIAGEIGSPYRFRLIVDPLPRDRGGTADEISRSRPAP
ncbi:MAG TPA: cyclic nucleotide-binding domain-containing protein [Aliidongia sp.]|nr:cyclic nucleotide-binding domain-containing protein [Aliidongia sp.]